MNEGKYNNQTITEYLLGTLPEADAERFDELSFTDEEFADALSSTENDLIDAYVQDELASEKLESFKKYYLASPLRREKVEVARAFQLIAGREVANMTEISAAPDSKQRETAAGFFSGINIFAALNPVLKWGFVAAALVLILFGGWIVSNRLNRQESQIVKQEVPSQITQQTPVEKERIENSNVVTETALASNENELPPKNSSKAQSNKQSASEQARTPKPENSKALPKLSVASFILAPPMRGSSQIPNFSIPREVGDVAVRLQLEANVYGVYRVELVNAAGKNLWHSGAIKIKSKGDSKTLNVRFPAKLLKSQVYSLSVSGITADGMSEIISNYSFRSVLR